MRVQILRVTLVDHRKAQKRGLGPWTYNKVTPGNKSVNFIIVSSRLFVLLHFDNVVVSCAFVNYAHVFRRGSRSCKRFVFVASSTVSEYEVNAHLTHRTG